MRHPGKKSCADRRSTTAVRWAPPHRGAVSGKGSGEAFSVGRGSSFSLESLVDSVHAKTGESRLEVYRRAAIRESQRYERPKGTYFSDGLAEELINALAHLPGLRVASRSSTFRFPRTRLGCPRRRQAVERRYRPRRGSRFRRHGTNFRVTVQLINVADGYHLWSERYDRELADVFAIEDEIDAIGRRGAGAASRNQSANRSPSHGENPEAFEVYLRGRHFWYQRTESSLRAGINCFMKADLDGSGLRARSRRARGLICCDAALGLCGRRGSERNAPSARQCARSSSHPSARPNHSLDGVVARILVYGGLVRGRAVFRKGNGASPRSSVAMV